MGKLNSTADSQNKNPKYSKECAIQAELEKLDMGTLEAVNNQYFKRFKKENYKKSVRGNFDVPYKKMIFKKVVKKGVQAHHISHLSFQKVTRREKMVTEFLSQVEVEKIDKLYLKGSTNLVGFSFYTRSTMKLIPKTVLQVKISFFKISHKDFGRVLISCNSKSRMKFKKCRISINHLDYFDNTQPMITKLDLDRSIITQPEEDTEDLNCLVKKIADSELNTCLKSVTIWLPMQYRWEECSSKKRSYHIGNFTVNIC
ncbi:unnamed protein product [Moneuplotes crassus]|uniref:Uncharacterized protein n=1 Tax=Euplotes crassus TaxID=5936 RepID=A0AAD1XVT4_EUPCR|nr:unnamed protein product [Moneuplotes crassus]